jgi:uncharacterized membrane protein YbaN (DUF454 family)
MNKGIKQKLMIALGWFFVVLGAIGAVLPLMPTTVFLIIALGIFSKSSPRFHQMLLKNRWFGAGLRQWEETKSISRQSKNKATVVIVLTFGVSIAVLHGRMGLQLMLVAIALILLSIIWSIKEG